MESITISQKCIQSNFLEEHGKESLLILSVLYRNYTNRGYLVFTLNSLFKQLDIASNRKTQKQNVINSLSSMFDTDFNNTNINDLLYVKHNIKKSKYVLVPDCVVDTIIFKKSKGVDKYILYNIYLSILKHRNIDNNTAFPSIQTIRQLSNVKSNSTVHNNISELEKLNIVAIDRGLKYLDDEGFCKSLNNTYSFPS